VSAATANVESKAFGVERIISQPVKPLLLHSSAAPAVDPTVVELKEDARIPRRQISDTAQFAVIPTALYLATNSARRFFERRVSRITRAWGSPNSPLTVRAGWNLGKR
jgi:hypothetical protein